MCVCIRRRRRAQGSGTKKNSCCCCCCHREGRGLHWTIRTADGLFISMWSSSSSSSLALVRAVVNIGFIFPEHHASSSSDGPLRETKDFSGFLSFILSSKYIQSLHCTTGPFFYLENKKIRTWQPTVWAFVFFIRCNTRDAPYDFTYHPGGCLLL